MQHHHHYSVEVIDPHNHPAATTLQDAPNEHPETNILTGTARHIQA